MRLQKQLPIGSDFVSFKGIDTIMEISNRNGWVVFLVPKSGIEWTQSSEKNFEGV